MLKFRVIDAAIAARLKGISARIKKMHRFWRRVQQHQASEAGLMFRHLKGGGRRRGVEWAPFARQYRRKTDGAEIPAWGGVERLDGDGVVQGRLRPSGRRVTPTSALMRDTGLLSSSVASSLRVRDGGRRAEFGTPVDYAAAQNRDRPFMFWTRKDAKLYRGWALRFLMQGKS